MTPELISSIVNSQNVLSALAVVVVIGFGLFVDRRVWPWWVVFSEQWRVDSVALRQRSLEVQERNDQRWYRTSEQYIHEVQTTAVVLSTVRAKQEDILAQIYGLREQLDDLEGFIFPDDAKPPKP